MYRFIKDFYLSAHGLDVKKIEKIEKERLELKKVNGYIFEKNTKIMLFIIATLCLIIFGIASYFSYLDGNMFSFIKNLIITILTLISMLFLFVKSREADIIVIVDMICIVLIVMFPLF